MIDKKLEKKSKENERSNEECDEKIEFDLLDLLGLIEGILCIGFVICGLAKMIFEFFEFCFR